MPNININTGQFNCQDPAWVMGVNMGTTYRISNTDYRLNYNWNSSQYDAIGVATNVILRYTLDGGTSQLYTGSLPDNATNFVISLPFHDEVLLQFEFQVDGGTCYTYVNVPYSEIVSIT
jgi:hypothetical protein